MSWRETAPRPSGLWVRWSPRTPPAVARPRIDLGRSRLLWPTAAGEARPAEGEIEPPGEPDLAYCPTGLDGVEGLEHRLRAARRAGCPALIHAFPGERVEVGADDILVWDLLAEILSARGTGAAFDDLAVPAPPRPCRLWIALPLTPGLWADLVGPGGVLDAVRRFDPEGVVGVASELSPADRRRLSEALGEESYEQIFHGEAPSERRFAAEVQARGLRWRVPRPAVPAAPPRRARNREIGAALAEAAELWLRLGRSEPEGSALLAAAHHVDESALDLAALVPEGNLEVVGWLSPLARGLVASLVESGRSPLLEELTASWSAPDGSG